MILLGNISDRKELAKYYSLANVTVITSKKETFSMVVAESLCCGTPVVGFKAGGPEQIALEKWSQFVEHGDVDGLISGIQKTVDRKAEKEIVLSAQEAYSQRIMVEKYVKQYVLGARI
jgi:glycosyltransferase involved in cell wall biosynthesis